MLETMDREKYTLKIGMISSSDIVVQIVDARNPLLFRCEDLVRHCFVFFFLLFLQAHGFHLFCRAIIVTEIFSVVE